MNYNQFTHHYGVDIYRNGEWQPLGGVCIPIADCRTLDDSLDYGQMILQGVKESGEIINPFDRLRIHVLKGEHKKDLVYYDVSGAALTQMTFNKPPYLYDYELDLIEPTKEIERCTIDSMTVTIPKGHDYLQGQIVIKPDNKGAPEGEYFSFNKDAFSTPVLWHQDFEVPLMRDVAPPKSSYDYPGTNLVSVTTPTWTYTQGANDIPRLVIPAEHFAGEINVHYQGFLYAGSVSVTMDFTYTFSAIENIPQKGAPTIPYVINRLLSAGKSRTKGTPAKYTLHPAIAEKYDSVLSPEFFFTRSTLRDALTQVGNFVHAIPRWDYFEAGTTPGGTAYPEGWYITFDELGGSEVCILPKSHVMDGILVPMTYGREYLTSEEYCGGLDSYGENILNTRHLVEGSITEPSYNGFQTTRTDSGYLIQNDTAMIATTMGIDRVTQLQIKYGEQIYDLTPWVFERAQYDTMTGYTGSYPYAKEYALVYTQGEKNITGLQFQPDGLVKAWNKLTIENIMESGFGIKLTGNYKDLLFNVTYIPYLTMRVGQKKAYTGWDSDNVLFHNQGANSVESEWYGQNLKGKLAMLGNATEERTYSCAHYEDVPKPGQILDGRYIAQVTRKFTRIAVDCTVILVKDFNKLNEYMAIDSHYRVYDVSEKQVVDRDVHIDEVFTIGDQAPADKNHLTDDAAGLFFQTLERALTGSLGDPTCMLARGEFDGGTTLQAVLLPVSSLSFGNSILYHGQYADNYSAGKSSNELPDTGPDGPNPDKVAEQKMVPYTDVNGELQYLNLRFATSVVNRPGVPYSLPAVTDADFEDPLFPTSVLVDFSSDGERLVIEKDNRERLGIGYQLHGQCNRRTLVIGTKLFADNPLVTRIDWTKKPVLAFLPERLSMLRPRVDITRAVDAGGSVSYTRRGRADMCLTVTADPEKLLASGAKSWVLYDPAEGADKSREYYLGENILSDADGKPMLPPVYFNL